MGVRSGPTTRQRQRPVQSEATRGILPTPRPGRHHPCSRRRARCQCGFVLPSESRSRSIDSARQEPFQLSRGQCRILQTVEGLRQRLPSRERTRIRASRLIQIGPPRPYSTGRRNSCCWNKRSCSSTASAGVFQQRMPRGRLLIAVAIATISAALHRERSVLFGAVVR